MSKRDKYELDSDAPKDTQLIEVRLTPNEREALRLKSKGLSYEAIAKELYGTDDRGKPQKTRQATYDMIKRAQRKLWRLESRKRYADNPGDTPIEEVPVVSRVRNGLRNAGYERLGQLAGMNRSQLHKLEGVGRHAAFQLYGLLQSLGVKKPHSFCPSCGRPLNEKFKKNGKIYCDACNYTVSIKVIAPPRTPKAVEQQEAVAV